MRHLRTEVQETLDDILNDSKIRLNSLFAPESLYPEITDVERLQIYRNRIRK